MYIVSSQQYFRKIKKVALNLMFRRIQKKELDFFGAPEVWGGGAKSIVGD